MAPFFPPLGLLNSPDTRSVNIIFVKNIGRCLSFFKMSSDQYTYKLYSEFAITHNDPAIDFDSAAAWNDINMDFSIPIGACELGVWIAKGNMQARHLLILQQVAHKSLETCKRTDGKFSHAVAFGGGEEVIIHFLCQRCILASDVCDIALFYANHN